jgi:type IV fimbrial biogenesis protein FimT
MGSKPRGATLWELAIVLMLVGVLASLAMPGFTALRQAAALAAAVNQTLLGLHYARSSALTRGLPVGLCQSDDGEVCSAAGQRLIVFVNADSDQPAQRDAGEALLRRYEIAATLRLHASRSAINYWPVPRAGTTTTFTFCDSRRAAAPRAVIVSQTGRPRTARIAADGSALYCP